jgi:hypothetical protein
MMLRVRQHRQVLRVGLSLNRGHRSLLGMYGWAWSDIGRSFTAVCTMFWMLAMKLGRRDQREMVVIALMNPTMVTVETNLSGMDLIKICPESSRMIPSDFVPVISVSSMANWHKSGREALFLVMIFGRNYLHKQCYNLQLPHPSIPVRFFCLILGGPALACRPTP